MSGDERSDDGDDDSDGGPRGEPPGVNDVETDTTARSGGPAGGSDASDAPDEETGVEDDGDWRFTLEDLAERDAKDSEGEDEGGEGIAGVFGPSEEIEPGTIDRESVVFVLLGAIVAGIGLYLMVAP